jgi:hypothetical protein
MVNSKIPQKTGTLFLLGYEPQSRQKHEEAA